MQVESKRDEKYEREDKIFEDRIERFNIYFLGILKGENYKNRKI